MQWKLLNLSIIQSNVISISPVCLKRIWMRMVSETRQSVQCMRCQSVRSLAFVGMSWRDEPSDRQMIVNSRRKDKRFSNIVLLVVLRPGQLQAITNPNPIPIHNNPNHTNPNPNNTNPNHNPNANQNPGLAWF